ncbi:unnamed protein product, partial [Tetraodon nigroviridis]
VVGRQALLDLSGALRKQLWGQVLPFQLSQRTDDGQSERSRCVLHLEQEQQRLLALDQIPNSLLCVCVCVCVCV